MTNPTKKKILIVGGEELFRISCAEALKAAEPDADVHIAPTEEEAISLASSEDVSLLIADVETKDIDIFQTLIPSLKKNPQTHILLTSDSVKNDLTGDIDESEAIVYLEKPFSIEQLVEVSKRLLQAKIQPQTERQNLINICQTLHTKKSSCGLKISTDNAFGLLYFNQGKLVDASIDETFGEDAAIEIFSWEEPMIEIDFKSTNISITIKSNISNIIIESLRIKQYRKAKKEIPVPFHDSADFSLRYVSSSTNKSISKPNPPTTQTLYSVHVASHAATSTKKDDEPMANVLKSLEETMKIEGAIGAAIADWQNGLTLGYLGGNGLLDMDVAASANCQVVRAKMEAMKMLNIAGGIQDILITLEDQIHLIRPLKKHDGIFLYLAADKVKGNLGLARHKLQAIEANFVL